MKKKLSGFLLIFTMFLFAGLGSASAALIDFSEVGVGTPDPSIAGVQFFAGDPASWNDTITDDVFPPGDPYLINGFDDGTGASPGMYDTFIGASAASFTFDTVTFDIALLDGSLPGNSTFWVDALSGGSSVASASVAFSDTAYHALSVNFATGFDTVHIYDGAGVGGIGEFFRIDNFNFTEYDPGGGPGPGVIPEPGTLLLFGTGLMGFAAIGRRRKKE